MMIIPLRTHRERILATVKTYPLPSATAREHVCTAGVREDGSFVRLYPLNFRELPPDQQFEKYSWISLEVKKRRKGDSRPESYEPAGQIEVERPPISSDHNWSARKRYVFAGPTFSMCQLEAMKGTERSLGIVRARRVDEFIDEPVERDWKPRWAAQFLQGDIFAPRKPLEKIPFKFSYRFFCDDPCCRGHKKMIIDWETGELFRKMSRDLGDNRRAVEAVRHRFFDIICGPDKDTHFFVGTDLEHASWIILGAFWPKKEPPRLF